MSIARLCDLLLTVSRLALVLCQTACCCAAKASTYLKNTTNYRKRRSTQSTFLVRHCMHKSVCQTPLIVSSFSQSVHKYVTQEYVRACLVSYDSLPTDVYHEGWGRPGSSHTCPHFRQCRNLPLPSLTYEYTLIGSLAEMQHFGLPGFMDHPHVCFPVFWVHLRSYGNETFPTLRRHQIQWGSL